MKIKPLVISLVALGFVSGGAFAADKVKAVKVTKKKAVKIETVNTAPVAAVAPAVSDTKAQQAVIDDNAVVNTTDSFNWFNRVQVGGLANADLLWGNHDPIGSYTNSGSVFDIFIPNANLLFDAKLNDYAAAHLNLIYRGTPAYYKGYLGSSVSTIHIDDAYVTISDLSSTPFYVRVGHQYLPFGDYERYPLIPTFTQALEESSETTVVLGVAMDNGFYASIYAFNGPTKEKSEAKYTIRNGGAKVGYYGNWNALYEGAKYNVNVSWMRNIYDNDNLYTALVGGFANPLITGNPTTRVTAGTGTADRVGGLAVHGDMTAGAFDFAGNFTAALNGLVQDISSFKTSGGAAVITSYTANSRLWLADIGAGYKFPTLAHDSRVGLIYQWSGNGEFTADLFQPSVLNFPHYAIDLTYEVNLMKNIDLGFAAEHNQSYDYRSAYSTIHGADISGKRDANLALTRLSVKF